MATEKSCCSELRPCEAADHIERLREDSNIWARRYKQAAERIEVLEAALRFYARRTAYRTSTVYMSGARPETEIEQDGGDRARAALPHP